MRINQLTITIDNFDNDAMVDDSTGELHRILRTLIELTANNDVATSGILDGQSLRDINDNTIGLCSVVWDEDSDGCQTCRREPDADYTIGCPGCEADEHDDGPDTNATSEEPSND